MFPLLLGKLSSRSLRIIRHWRHILTLCLTVLSFCHSFAFSSHFPIHFELLHHLCSNVLIGNPFDSTCLSAACLEPASPPIRLSCCIVSHPVALYCKDSLHFVNGLFKSDKAEEEEAYVPDVWSFLSLSRRSSRSRSTSLIAAAILYKRSSCIGCRVIQRQTHTRNRQQQSWNTVKLRCGKVGGQRRKRKAALENLKEATETCTEPQGDIKRFNEAHEPRVTVRRNLLWGKTLRSVSAEGQEEGELTCVPPCISSSSSNPNTLPPL